MMSAMTSVPRRWQSCQVFRKIEHILRAACVENDRSKALCRSTVDQNKGRRDFDENKKKKQKTASIPINNCLQLMQDFNYSDDLIVLLSTCIIRLRSFSKLCTNILRAGLSFYRPVSTIN